MGKGFFKKTFSNGLRVFFFGLALGIVGAVLMYMGLEASNMIVKLFTMGGGLIALIGIFWSLFSKKPLN